ncbi:autoinducer binding domain-containing protein [Novosphingobium sp. G106]|uniref:helix-turn-helix transcriptional regulator n=1 Tax=Novosphingobium sp. G106 TaxID=2849500 RepID=UPI001C2DAFEA|nr:autoinducer binding domain-containing protein [Novosphingobium sp. G106]MBV1687706.1 autoinducer binding domain-containing protein [Novosphingobium sp. G106]
MLNTFDLNTFIADMRGAGKLADLEAILIELTQRLGFEQFALGHHVDLTRPPEGAVRLTNYAQDWVDQAIEKRFFFDDPVHAASARIVRPFLWDEIPTVLKMTDPHREILDRGRAYGLVEGFTVPVHQPGEYNGTCTFASRSFEGLHPFTFPVAQMISTFAFECARDLMRLADGKEPEEAPHITGRQRESLILLARGKTDPEIAEVMRISRGTAHDHVEAVRRAYGNAQRPYLILRALYDGNLTFPDVLGPNWFRW